MLALRRARVLIFRAVKGYFRDGCSHRAAAISYYVLFSLFPLVIFSVGILGLVLRDAELQADLVDNVMDSIPLSQDEGRNDVKEALDHVASDRSGAIGLVGLVALAWSGSAMFGVVRASLNAVFQVEAPRPIVMQKLLDLGIVLAVTPFFIASIVATSALRLARRASEDLDVLGEAAQELGVGWWVASTVLPIMVSFAAFFAVYLIVPARRTPARYVWPGALLAAVLFEAVKIGFSIYLENFSSYDVIFGSLGAVVAFLFWVYLSSNILLFSAEVVAETPEVLTGAYDQTAPASGPKRSTGQKLLRGLRGLVLRPRAEKGEPPPADGSRASEESSDT